MRSELTHGSGIGGDIAHRPLAPFGIEASVDAHTLGEADKQELLRLFRIDGLLLLRAQLLSMAEQIDLCAIFGPVLPNSLENYLVSNVHEDGLLGAKELLFHNDVPFVPKPYLGGSLHALEVTDDASATRFVSGLRAYDRLPAQLRSRVDQLNGLHVRKRVEGRRSRLTDLRPGDLATVHTVVGRQNGTGREYLFVNEDMTDSLVGLPPADSEQLLAELFEHLYAPTEVYEHRWRNGDIVIWDNLAVQHARHEIAPGARRTLQRVTITELGFYDQIPSDRASYDNLRTAVQPA